MDNLKNTIPDFSDFVLSEMPGQVAVFNTDLQYIYVNPGAIRNPEIRSWIIGKTDHDYCVYRSKPLELAQERMKRLHHVLTTGNAAEYEERLVNDNGSVSIYSRKISRVQDKNKNYYLVGYGIEITSIHNMQEDLKRKNNFLDLVLNTSPHLIFVKDDQHRFVLVNKATGNAFGMTPEEVQMKFNADIHHTESELEVYNKVDNRVIHHRETIRLEEAFTRYDGVTEWYDTIKTPLDDPDGGKKLLAISTNITQQKLNAEKAKQRELELIDAQELTKSGNWRFSPNGQVFECSPGLYKLLELPEGTSVSLEKIAGLCDTGYDIDFLTAIRNAKNQGTESQLELILLTQTGRKAVIATVRLRKHHNDTGYSLFGTMLDVSEQKKTEHELRYKEQRLNLVSKLARTGSYEFDLRHHTLQWSLGTFEIFEKDPDTGAPVLEEYIEHVYPEDKHILENILYAIKSSTELLTTEYRIITYSGKIKYVKIITQPEFDVQGNIIKVIGSINDLTEQKLIEQELRMHQQNLEEAQDLARLGSWRLNPVSLEIWWSDGLYKIWERDPSLGSPSFEEFEITVHPEDKEHVRDSMKNLIRTEQQSVSEYRIITPSGTVKHLLVRAKPSYKKDGKLDYFFGTLIDLTDVKQAEEKLRKSEESLAEAQTLSRMGSWEFELKDRKLSWSTGMYDLVKRDKNQPPPGFREFLRSVHTDDREQVIDMVRSVRLTRINQELEFRIQTTEGDWLYVYSRVFARNNREGKLTSLHGTLIDISERRHTEELLRENERSLVEAQEMARSGNFSINLTNGINMWSPGMFKLTEYNKATPPSLEEFFTWVDDIDRERLQKFHNAVIQERVNNEIEYALNLPNGKKIIVLARAKLTVDVNGNPIMVSGTVTDITQQAEARKILMDMKEQSEEMIRAKEYFLANISHELKTPLNGILGMARLLQKTDLNSTQRKYTDILNNTAGNLLVIINDILDVAKIESGKLSLEKIPFDPRQVADTAIQVQMYKAEEKDLVLRHLHIGKPLPVVIGDPYRLNQILLNLLSNAIKFTPNGDVILTHTIKSETEDQVVIEFSVQDTGIGISEDKVASIFESFMQVHDTTQEYYGGTGLGLTISKNLVEMQGGSIHVESKAGQGSRFYFLIPYQKATEKEGISSEQQRIDIKNLGALKILLAEDNRVNQFITEAMLLDWGFKVDVADNGLEALELMRRNDYDLVLMDIQMPGMSGLEATHAIREMEDSRKSKIPIIALTANTTKNAQKKFIAEGMNDCLIKPFKEETLFRRIIQQLEGEERFKMAFKRKRFPTRKQPVPSGEQLYNLDLLRKDARNNTQFIRRMLQIFLDTIPPIIDRMDEHLEKGEMDAISTLAHKIKPTIDGTGIAGLHDTIRNIENYREKKRSREQMATDLVRMREVITAVTDAFKKELDELKT